IAGLWTGADVREQRRLGLIGEDTALDSTRDRLSELAGLDDDASVTDVIEAVHARLAEAPSLLVTATLDDALAASERPNVPGTSSDGPTGPFPRPLPPGAPGGPPLPRRIAATLAARRA